MSNEEIKKKIIELTKLLNQWNYEYYALDNPSVDDFTYDAKLRELLTLENQYPQYKQHDSPTCRVGGIVLDKFQKIKHITPMLSLDNVFNENELQKFYDDIHKTLNKKNLEFVVEPKIDGLSISIIYEHCKLKYACTRGDGQYGEDVTNNILTIKNIPLYINEKYQNDIIEVRGEVYMSKDSLIKLNETNEKKFSNTRNAAAGTLRNLDSSIVNERKLEAFFYYVINHKNNILNTQYESIEWLKKHKFPVSSLIKKCDDFSEIYTCVNEINNMRDNLEYEIDGAVIKLNEQKYYEEVGFTSKFPKWAIAYKFPPKIVSTKLLDIKTNVGRTGKINFIAELEPILLNGSIISAATLHNLDFIKQKNIYINDYVNIYKAGDVIPYVEGVNLNCRNSNEIYKYEFNYKCPCCNSDVVNFNDNIDYFCINENCDEKQIRVIEYFVSKDVMNIEGISYSIIKKFYEAQYIKNQWDLYKLQEYHNEIINGNFQIKDKLFNKLINAINNSKNNSLERLIAGLNIKNVGITIATVLAKKFQTLTNLANATMQELLEINIIGDTIAKNIVDFFQLEKTKEIIDRINSLKINTQYFLDEMNNYNEYALIAQNNNKQQYKNKNVVITGTFSMSRDEIKKILEIFYNCKIQNSVTKKTDYVLAGQDCGSKLQKAQELNIQIINNEFWKE